MKKGIIGLLLLVSAVSFSEMTTDQKYELDKLTKIFYPDNNMRADRSNFERIQTNAYNEIMDMREDLGDQIIAEEFDKIWAGEQRKFPGDFIQQKKELIKALDGYKMAEKVNLEREEKKLEQLKALNEEALEDILEIKEEENMVPKDIMDKIIREAEEEFPNDHVSQKEEIDNKIKAYEDMLQYFDLESPKK